MRIVSGMTETALTEFPAPRPVGLSPLNHIADKVSRACASLAAAIREVLDDRFWA
jgi:hypothetical protein